MKPDRPQTRIGLVSAIAAFAVVCGLVLLFAGPGVTCGPVGQSLKSLNSQLLQALQETQSADQALQVRNYGTARRHIQNTQAWLTRALNELNGPEERIPRAEHSADPGR